MKVVVAGGSGFLGRHISAALISNGHMVTVLSRRPEASDPIPLLEGARAVRADVTQPPTLSGVLDGIGAVVMAVQFPNYPMEVPRRGLTFDAYDRGGTENLLAEARRAGVELFVYMSGAGAAPDSELTWYRAKGRAETAIAASGIDHVILRPSWAYGPGDRALNRFVTIARYSPLIPRLGLGTQRIQPVFVADVAEAVARAVATEEARNHVFEIGGPEVLTMSEVIATMCEVLQRRRVIVPVPATLAKLAVTPLQLLPTPPMTPGGIDFAIQDGIVDTAELERLLGLHPRSLREGLARYLGP